MGYGYPASENERGKKLKCLKSDNRVEYCSKEFKKYCAYNGIHREKTTPRGVKWCVRKDEYHNHGACKDHEAAHRFAPTTLG